jgi:transposase
LPLHAAEPHTKEPVMKKGTTYVGLDVHKRTIAISVRWPGVAEPEERVIPHEPRAVRRWVRRMKREAEGPIRCAYEAGPCGYGLQRELLSEGLECQVIAPSLIPRKPGERIKTDRRDARKLGELLQGGQLTEVHAPTPEAESVRDLCRAREDAKEDQTRARHRLSKFLLRRSLVWGRGRAWSQAHQAWLRGLRLDHAADQGTFDAYCLALDQAQERLRILEAQLAEWSQVQPYATPVAWLRCFHGIETTTAMTLVTELHDFRRFRKPRQLMAYLGLVPSEDSSGDRTQRGGITKTGNSHARRVLIESAWHYRHPPRGSAALRKRRAGQPARVIALADRAHQRLSRRYRRMTARGKPHNKVVVAVARELVGSLWATLASDQGLAV